MICYRILPLDIEQCVEKQELSISELISDAKKHLGDADLMIIVNGKIISDQYFIIREKDEVIVVQEFLGG